VVLDLRDAHGVQLALGDDERAPVIAPKVLTEQWELDPRGFEDREVLIRGADLLSEKLAGHRVMEVGEMRPLPVELSDAVVPEAARLLREAPLGDTYDAEVARLETLLGDGGRLVVPVCWFPMVAARGETVSVSVRVAGKVILGPAPWTRLFGDENAFAVVVVLQCNQSLKG